MPNWINSDQMTNRSKMKSLTNKNTVTQFTLSLTYTSDVTHITAEL
jgi:hypothetical protein